MILQGWGKGRIRVFDQTETHWCQNDGWSWRSLSKKPSSIVKNLLEKHVLKLFQMWSLCHSTLWSPWSASKAFQSQHIYVFTLSLSYCCMLSQIVLFLKRSSDYQNLDKKSRLFPLNDSPPPYLLTLSTLKVNVVMLQLSNNPHLIKYLVSVINFLWTEIFSAWKAKVDDFVLIYFPFVSVLLSAKYMNRECLQWCLLNVDLPLLLFGVSDVDECSKDNVCLRGECLNTDGSFLCLCEAGFKYSDEAADCEGKRLCCLLIYVRNNCKATCQHWQFAVALLAMTG